MDSLTRLGGTPFAGQPRSTSAGGVPRCVGRERELSALEQLLGDAAVDGRGRVAYVSGPAGIGRTRLLVELRRRLQSRGVLVAEGRSPGLGPGMARAYQPLIEAVESLVRGLADLGYVQLATRAVDVAQALKGCVEPGAQGSSKHGQAALTRSGDATRWPVTSVAQEMRQAALYERVASLLTDVSRHQPLVLLLDDLHLADGATRALVHHLCQTRCTAAELDAPADDRLRGLIVLTSRERAGSWIEGVAARAMELAPLDLDGIRDFFQSHEALQRVADSTGGLPRSLESLLASSPADVDALWQLQFERLAPVARTLLGAIATLAHPASADFLARATRLAAESMTAASPAWSGAHAGGDGRSTDFSHALAEALDSRLLVKVVVDGEVRLGFARAGDEARTLGALDPPLLRALHCAVGRLLWERGDEADRVWAAEHLCRGRDGERAVDAALAAGERLELSFSHERALALYRQAHALTGSDERSAILEARIVELDRLAGDYPEALDFAQRLLARRPEEAAAHRLVGQLHLLRDEHGHARAALDRARALAVGSTDAIEIASVIAISAELWLAGGRHDEAIRECEAGLDAIMARGDGDDAPPATAMETARLRLEVRNTLGKVQLAEGRYQEAARLFTVNLDEARAAGIPFEEARALINQGIASLRLGNDVAAAACYRAALTVAEGAGDHRHRAFCLQNLGVLAHWKCDFRSALRYFHEAVAAFKKIGQRGRLAWLALDLASLHLDLGADERAAAMAQLAERLVDGHTMSTVLLKQRIIAGRLARQAGQWATAREHLRAAQSASANHSELLAEATLQLACVEIEAGDPAAAGECLRLLSTDAEHLPISGATRARALLVGGEVARLRGESGAARAALLESAQLFHHLGALDGEWRSHYALAQLATQSSDHAEAERRLRLAALSEARLRELVPEEFLSGFDRDPARRALLRALDEAPARPALPVVAAALVSAAVDAAAVDARVVTRARGECGAPDGAVPPSAPFANAERYCRMVGKSARMRQIYSLVEKVAPHDSLVLVRGESGTGKELIADAIHARSQRANQPIVKVNCGALVETLLLSELFGHERGAFTGAVQRKKGRFEAAHHGTIFLDEIGDISPRTQAALLRVIQEREFERVGSNTPLKVDVRIICATHRDLEGMVATGEFREDLYYRLQGVQIDLPPLRERADDIPALADDILRRIAEERAAPLRRLGPAAQALLAGYRWAGNVRELENVLRSVSLFADGAVLEPGDFSDYPEIQNPLPPASPVVQGARASGADTAGSSTAWERLEAEGIGLRELQIKIEIECITRALGQSNGNITRAAQLLRMKRPRLSQLIKEYGIAV